MVRSPSGMAPRAPEAGPTHPILRKDRGRNLRGKPGVYRNGAGRTTPRTRKARRVRVRRTATSRRAPTPEEREEARTP